MRYGLLTKTFIWKYCHYSHNQTMCEKDILIEHVLELLTKKKKKLFLITITKQNFKYSCKCDKVRGPKPEKKGKKGLG